MSELDAEDPQRVARALRALRGPVAAGPELVARLDALARDDTRCANVGTGDWPKIVAIACLALDALSAVGARAPIVAAADRPRTLALDVPHYDQGVYIGCYSTKPFDLRSYAQQVLSRYDAEAKASRRTDPG